MIRNITQFTVFVIAVYCFFTVTSCKNATSANVPETITTNVNRKFSEPKILGSISDNNISESSGLIASKCNDAILWTHNDSGASPILFAIRKTGEVVGEIKVINTENYDWEDISSTKNSNGKCSIFIADIGNNSRGRSQYSIVEIEEPVLDVDRKTVRSVSPTNTYKFEFSDMRHDSEAFFVHPVTGDFYLATKRISGPSAVYKIPRDANHTKATKVGEISVPAIPNGYLTGADVSTDGKYLVVVDYFNAYEFTLPANAKNFDEMFSVKPQLIELGKRDQGESIAYSTDGNAIYATSELANSPIIEVTVKK